MKATIIHNPHCFEFLPSLMLQHCLGKYMLYLAWGTVSVEVELN